MTHTYWMAEEPKALISKMDEYDTQWRTYGNNPFYDMWFRNSYAYYSTVLDADSVISSINFRGNKGELVEMKVPQARSLVQQMKTLINKQRLSFQVISTMDSYNYLQSMRKADGIVAQEIKYGGMDLKRNLVTEMALVLGTGYYACLNRFDRGRQVGVSQAGGPIFEGEPEIFTPHPTDVIFDFRITPFTDVSWVRIRVKRNRYDYMAMFPDLADKIAALPSCWERSAQTDSFFATDDRDSIYVYEVIHRKSPALPAGRYLSYSDDATVYYDDDNFYDGIPLEPVIPENIFTYGIGYPMLSNLLPSQEMYDHDFSAVATNHSALAIRNLAIARNSNVSIKSMPGGLNLIQYTSQNVPGGGKPEVLDFNTPNGDVYTFQDKLLNNMQQMSNVNSAIRGDVGSDTAGVTIATLTTNALEFLNGYSTAVQIATENILYWKVKILAATVKNDRELSVERDDGVSTSETFTGDDLKGVKGIKLVATNPLMQTTAGRSTIAKEMMAAGQVKSPQEYISILDGSPLSRLWGNELSQNDLILYEKEQVLRGEQPLCMPTDNHPMHIHEHAAIFNNPATRTDPKITKANSDHIMEHLQMSQTTDPLLMAMAATGQMPQGGLPPPTDPTGGGGGGPMDQPEVPGGDGGPMDQPGVPGGEPASPAQDLLGRGE